jgi:hypothetical protein
MEKGSLFSWATEAIWTKVRLREAGYEIPDDLCELCKEAPDTSHHRLFCCEGKQEVKEIRQSIFAEWEVSLLKEMGPGWLVSRGLCKHPGDFIPPPLPVRDHLLVQGSRSPSARSFPRQGILRWQLP